MKYFQVLTAILFVAFMLGCSSISVQYDYDREYDFSQFKTYRWASGQEINPQDELVKYPLILKRVQTAADNELQAKGLKKVEEDEESDVVVLAHAGSKERMQVTQTGGYGAGYRGWYDPWWGAYGGQTNVSYYEEATLVIDIVAWEQKELAWRGMATGTVKENQNAESQQKRIDGIVAKIFANYPPGTIK
jgi:hypothetical protein